METTETRWNCDLCGYAIHPDDLKLGANEANPEMIMGFRESVYYGGVITYHDFCLKCGPKLTKLIHSNFPKRKGTKE